MIKKITASVITFFIIFGIATGASAQHYVKPGESMSKIAKVYNMTVKDLISLNPHIVNPNIIKPNDYIIIRSKIEPQKDLVDYARSLQDITTYVFGGQNFPNKQTVQDGLRVCLKSLALIYLELAGIRPKLASL